MPDNIFYQDLDLNPTVTSEGDVSSAINRDAIKQSLYMIINTNKGSRIFNPNYGCRIEGYLFEPFDEITGKQIGKEIEESIKNYEPRIQLTNINVNMNPDNFSYEISITYRITNTLAVDSLKINLQKL